MGIKDTNIIYNTQDLASGEVMFSATGVTRWNFTERGVNKAKYCYHSFSSYAFKNQNIKICEC